MAMVRHAHADIARRRGDSVLATVEDQVDTVCQKVSLEISV